MPLGNESSTSGSSRQPAAGDHRSTAPVGRPSAGVEQLVLGADRHGRHEPAVRERGDGVGGVRLGHQRAADPRQGEAGAGGLEAEDLDRLAPAVVDRVDGARAGRRSVFRSMPCTENRAGSGGPGHPRYASLRRRRERRARTTRTCRVLDVDRRRSRRPRSSVLPMLPVSTNGVPSTRMRSSGLLTPQTRRDGPSRRSASPPPRAPPVLRSRPQPRAAANAGAAGRSRPVLDARAARQARRRRRGAHAAAGVPPSARASRASRTATACPGSSGPDDAR